MNNIFNDCELLQISDSIFSAHCEYSFVDVNDNNFDNISFTVIPKVKPEIDVRYEAVFLHHAGLTHEQILTRKKTIQRYKLVKQKLLSREYPTIKTKYVCRSIFASKRARIKGRFASKLLT